MLRFKDKNSGREKFILRDNDYEPQTIDDVVLKDDENNDDEDPAEYPNKETEDETVRHAE